MDAIETDEEEEEDDDAVLDHLVLVEMKQSAAEHSDGKGLLHKCKDSCDTFSSSSSSSAAAASIPAIACKDVKAPACSKTIAKTDNKAHYKMTNDDRNDDDAEHEHASSEKTGNPVLEIGVTEPSFGATDKTAATSTTSTRRTIAVDQSVPGAFRVTGRLGMHVDESDQHTISDTVSAFTVQHEDEDTVIGAAYVVDAATEQDQEAAEEVAGDTSNYDPEMAMAGAITIESLPPEGEEEEDVVDAKPMTSSRKDDRTSSRWAKWVAFAIVLVSLVTVVAVASAMLSRSSSDATTGSSTTTNGSDQPAEQDSDGMYPPFSTDLPLPIVAEMNNTESPLHHANRWIIEDPNMATYIKDRLEQRFNLVALYHLFGGDNWTRNDDWLSYEIHECDRYSGYRDKSPDVPICDEEGHLTVIDLASNNMVGIAPQIPLRWPYLRIWDIAHNELDGPVWLHGDSPKLEIYSVSHNLFKQIRVNGAAFSGPLALREIRMDGNMLEGELKGLLWYLIPKLEVWNITSNR